MADDKAPFLARWSQRKAHARDVSAVEEPAASPVVAPATDATQTLTDAASPVEAASEAATIKQTPAETPPPTLEDVALLTRDSDFSSFVARNVQPDVRNAALKKLFTDPQFNVMDGLDTYIDDYGRPDPLPRSMLRQMAQSVALGLFDDDKDDETPDQTHPAHTKTAPTDEDPDLQLQPDHAARRPGSEPGAGEDPAGQH